MAIHIDKPLLSVRKMVAVATVIMLGGALIASQKTHSGAVAISKDEGDSMPRPAQFAWNLNAAQGGATGAHRYATAQSNGKLKTKELAADGLYEQALLAEQCAHADEWRAQNNELANQNVGENEDSGDANTFQSMSEDLYRLCRDNPSSAAKADALMQQAANAGNQEAKLKVLDKQVRALEQQRTEQGLDAETMPSTPEQRLLIARMQDAAIKTGRPETLFDLASFYLSGNIIPSDITMAAALNAAAKSKIDKVHLDESLIFEGVPEEFRSAALTKAKEIHALLPTN